MTAGLDTLAALRRSGLKPKRVDISTHIPAHPRLTANVADWNAISGHLVWCVAVTEPPSRLDLRPLQGLSVEVDGTDTETVTAMAEACKKAGASRVIAGVHRVDQHGTFHSVWQTDTEGVLSHGELPV